MKFGLGLIGLVNVWNGMLELCDFGKLGLTFHNQFNIPKVALGGRARWKGKKTKEFFWGHLVNF
jgi:hypothetical protein